MSRRQDREYLKQVGAADDTHHMLAFRRAMGYLLPYKARLTGVVICVMLIATLWATGLSVILPAAKIFFSEEGLHGWVDKRAVEHRIDVALDSTPELGQKRQNSWGIHNAAIVRSVGKEATSSEPLVKGDYLLGLDGQPLEFEQLVRKLTVEDGRSSADVLVYHSADDRTDTVTLKTGPVGLANQLMIRAVSRIPRPAIYSERYRLFVWVLGISLVLTVLRDIFRILQDYLVQTTVQKAMIDLRRENFATALRLPMSFFATSGTSDTISRFMADTNQLSQGLITLLGKTLVEPAKLVSTFVVAMCMSWKLTLLACVAGPPTYFIIRKMGAVMRRATRKVLHSQGRMLRVLSETLTGVRVVKAYTTEGFEEQRFKAITKQLYKELKPMSASDAITGPSIESLGIAAAMVAAGIAGHWVFQGDKKPEDFFVLLGVLAALFDPVRKLSPVITKFHASDAAAARVFELRDRPIEKDAPGAIELPRHSKTIEFRGVTFTYANAATPSLKDVSLTIRQGQCVAVVGGNGSGRPRS
jgi:ATP-binding cassette, subfamily B, bacterial MsbA